MSEWAKTLRDDFPAEQIGKLPRVTCKECSQSQSKVCGKHSKSSCPECGNYITSAHMHLDYVGHAAVTDRLLKADPEWTYELVRDPNGLPFTVTSGFSDPYAKVGLWIDLLVRGTRTPGFGEGKNFKEAISDAIRNAAMRRGVALKLWSKEDLDESGGGTTAGNGSGDPPGSTESKPAPRAGASSSSPAQKPDDLGLKTARADFVAPNLNADATDKQKNYVKALMKKAALTEVQSASIGDPEKMTKARAMEVIEKLERLIKNKAAA